MCALVASKSASAGSGESPELAASGTVLASTSEGPGLSPVIAWRVRQSGQRPSGAFAGRSAPQFGHRFASAVIGKNPSGTLSSPLNRLRPRSPGGEQRCVRRILAQTPGRGNQPVAGPLPHFMIGGLGKAEPSVVPRSDDTNGRQFFGTHSLTRRYVKSSGLFIDAQSNVHSKLVTEPPRKWVPALLNSCVSSITDDPLPGLGDAPFASASGINSSFRSALTG